MKKEFELPTIEIVKFDTESVLNSKLDSWYDPDAGEWA